MNSTKASLLNDQISAEGPEDVFAKGAWQNNVWVLAKRLFDRYNGDTWFRRIEQLGRNGDGVPLQGQAEIWEGPLPSGFVVNGLRLDDKLLVRIGCPKPSDAAEEAGLVAEARS